MSCDTAPGKLAPIAESNCDEVEAAGIEVETTCGGGTGSAGLTGEFVAVSVAAGLVPPFVGLPPDDGADTVAVPAAFACGGGLALLTSRGEAGLGAGTIGIIVAAVTRFAELSAGVF